MATISATQTNWLNQVWRFRIPAIIGMMIGSLVVLVGIVYINNLTPEKPKKAEKSAMMFKVVKQVKTPKKPKPVPKKQSKPKPAKTPPPVALMPNLGVGLSGIDFGLGGYDPNAALPGVNDSVLGDTSQAVMTAATVDQQPRALNRPPLEYPARAKAKEIEGYVLLSVLIDENGKVAEVRVLESDPQGTFEDVAIRNIKNWQFEPARYQGKPVKTWINQSISFQLG